MNFIMQADNDKGVQYWIKESIKNKSFQEYYEIEKELGRGGTAVVFSCIHKGTGKRWATKVINKAENQTMKLNILQEVGVIFKLDHPNVVRLKEIYESETTLYLIMELVTGGELFDRVVQKGVYSECDAAKCMRDILAGLKYLHENDVIHRDLKPENLLYTDSTDDAALKIADFGLSTVVRSNVYQQSVCGTPGYCAPEIIRGLAHGAPVDMWSLGVILYILLSGYEPFYGDNDKAIFRRILKCDYQFDSPYWDNISANAKDLVRKLLVMQPQGRLTAMQACQHPWVRGLAARSDHLEQTQTKLKEFNARRRLKAVSIDVRFAVALTRSLSEKRLLNQASVTESADVILTLVNAEAPVEEVESLCTV